MITLCATPRLAALWSQVSARTDAEDLSHDLDHVARVTAWCVRLAPEAGAPPELAAAAGMVHDLVNVPKESAERPLGSERSAAASRGLLDAAGFEPAEVDAVVEAVRTCSWSRGLSPTGPLGRVLQDADRLDAIGAVGLARTFACAQAMHHRAGDGHLLHPADPGAETARALDDRHYAVDHLPRKLLLLAEGLHTPTAQAEGRARHALLATFLAQVRREALPYCTRTATEDSP